MTVTDIDMKQIAFIAPWARMALIGGAVEKLNRYVAMDFGLVFIDEYPPSPTPSTWRDIEFKSSVAHGRTKKRAVRAYMADLEPKPKPEKMMTSAVAIIAAGA